MTATLSYHQPREGSVVALENFLVKENRRWSICIFEKGFGRRHV